MLGAVLGNYRVMEQLGEGGMGVVYIGRHEQLGHRVAVKVLQLELSRDADMVRRFFNEAQAATAIRNPGIVQIFDFGTIPDGRAYFVMELLDGGSLSARLRQRRLDYAECCRIGRQVANVLHAAHMAGITHRDLKPDNLFLVPDPEVIGGERVKVLDFGIAKLAGDTHTLGVKTRTGLMMGTPQYMSPEQSRGAGAVDARSDIYSLGCILFEMACGRPPFVGEGVGEVLGAHQYLEPPQPRSFAPNIPARLAKLVIQMLAKHPDARPPTMAVVAQALDEILRTLDAAPRRAPTPLPVLQTSPASTTLGGAAGMTSASAYGAARRRPVVLGSLVVVGALSAIIAVLATSDSDERDPSAADNGSPTASQPEKAAVAEARADEAREDEAREDEVRKDEVRKDEVRKDEVRAAETTAAAPTPAEADKDKGAATTVDAAPPPPPEAAATAPVGNDVELENECIGYRTAEKWADLDACSERLKQTNPKLAKELKDRAVLESASAPHILAVEAALRKKDLKLAHAELNLIRKSSTRYQRTKAAYQAAEEAAIRDTIANLERAKGGDCKEYLRIVAQERQAKPPRVVEESQRKVACVVEASPPACDAAKLDRDGTDLFVVHRLSAALAAYEKAYACKPEPHYLRKAFVVACNIPDVRKARTLWRKLSPTVQKATLGECIRNGVTEQQLTLLPSATSSTASPR